MSPKELNQNYQEKKDIFHNYIDTIKKIQLVIYTLS